ncbi:hypothetical protein [Niveispirillum cyanobacteriorum]|uniref:Uncharacterized protein n=1 Tax=Niveispirillum cyanobacteriorum TaxID=1612173 RepID=A0A2K9NAK6_9PROT|nr:hypothetical protein [Niveispirillum cyanobacteriorum]AUN30117.1 hypothetical protein C0V82_07640 [Niveispirillum cyanobacteriorum]GGE57800.1 hypothetical protein GCM10011317_14640 [Niveispirillum cyanobacteriorum]
MTDFGLFIVRPPQGVATVAAIHPSRADDARVTLKKLRSGGFMIKALSKASVPSTEPEGARLQLQGLVNGMFEQAPYRPAVSLVW